MKTTMRIQTTSKRLPETLWEMIRVALADEAKAYRSKNYSIDMDDWHVPHEDYCEVCLAGAVMAFSLGAGIHDHLGPADFKEHYKLEALDEIRSGDIPAALTDMYCERSCPTEYWKDWWSIARANDISTREHYKVTPYEQDRKTWRRDMYRIARILRKADL